jgi:hypothetical protein
MNRDVVKMMMGLLVSTMLGMTGCGGGSEQNIPLTPPLVSNLQYNPTSLTVNTPTNINWQFDFTDAGGDIATGTYTVYNPSSVAVYTKTINLTIPAGVKAGTEHGTTSNVTFVTVGTYTANMFVMDSVGANSNTLTATFTIVP